MSVSKQDLIPALAEQLKQVIKKPEWAIFVKTGVFKDRPPVDSDWWYIRAASVLLKVEKLEPVGVSKLRTKYGGRKNRGVAPEHFRRGSGKILRTILQQLETAGLLKQEKKAVHRGRLLTGKAKSLIAKVSRAVDKPKPKAVEKPVEKPVEKKQEAKAEPEVKAEAHKEASKPEAVKQEAKQSHAPPASAPAPVPAPEQKVE